MTRVIGQRELRNDNATVIAAVAAGETFIVTRNGRPVAELRPLEQRRPRLVSRADILRIAARGPHVDWREFRRDLDRVADQGL